MKKKTMNGKFTTPVGCQLDFRGKAKFHLAKKGRAFDAKKFVEAGILEAGWTCTAVNLVQCVT
jgi:hypothetical protein